MRILAELFGDTLKLFYQFRTSICRGHFALQTDSSSQSFKRCFVSMFHADGVMHQFMDKNVEYLHGITEDWADVCFVVAFVTGR